MKFEDFLSSVQGINFLSNSSVDKIEVTSHSSDFIHSYKQASMLLSKERKDYLKNKALETVLDMKYN